MSAIKTAWHPPFTGLLRERCPKWVRITAEVQLTTEPLRVDDLLEVWSDRPHDAQDRGATFRALGVAIAEDGYRVVRAFAMPLLVVDLGVVAEREDDDLLRWFAGHRIRTLEAQRWVRQHQGARRDDMGTNATPDLEGYDEWIAQYVASLAPEHLAHALAGLAPEQRLAGLSPEQRLAGLSESELVLSLPDRLLRLLPESYVETLPEPTRARVRARRGA